MERERRKLVQGVGEGRKKVKVLVVRCYRHISNSRRVEEIPLEMRSVDKWKNVFFVMPLPMLPTLSMVCCKGWDGCE